MSAAGRPDPLRIALVQLRPLDGGQGAEPGRRRRSRRGGGPGGRPARRASRVRPDRASRRSGCASSRSRSTGRASRRSGAWPARPACASSRTCRVSAIPPRGGRRRLAPRRGAGRMTPPHLRHHRRPRAGRRAPHRLRQDAPLRPREDGVHAGRRARAAVRVGRRALRRPLLLRHRAARAGAHARAPRRPVPARPQRQHGAVGRVPSRLRALARAREPCLRRLRQRRRGRPPATSSRAAAAWSTRSAGSSATPAATRPWCGRTSTSAVADEARAVGDYLSERRPELYD